MFKLVNKTKARINQYEIRKTFAATNMNSID